MPQNHSTTSDSDRLRAVALVCTLKPSPARSSSRLLAEHPVAATTGALARNAAHPARLLRTNAYPPYS